MYLSLGADERRTYHQKDPHTQREKCATHELVHELIIAFTITRNTTFQRFFKSTQQSLESLETFYSKIREAEEMFQFKDLENDLVKDLFISNMNNTSIQMDISSEVRTQQQNLNSALKEKNVKEINKKH